MKKQELLKALAELGVDAAKNTKNEELQAMLDEARRQAADRTRGPSREKGS